jgi:hypothetical protein
MKITFHGGECCGIKHISGLGNDPERLVDEIDNPKPDNDHAAYPDTSGREVSSDQNFFYGKAPKESCLNRLDRYIKYIDKVRPYGVIEIVLCDYRCAPWMAHYNQIPAWEPVLLKRDFVLVTPCFNSNSDNKIFIYHRKTDKE